MADIESQLISGRGNNYIQIPTAAALEGEKSLNYWKELGIAQANRIGVNPVPLIIKDLNDANNPKFLKDIDDAGLIYFSGGNPHHLSNTFRDSLVWKAIESAWRNGSALAGCSAGAMAIANHIPDFKGLRNTSTAGLAILPNIRVIPHFDRYYMAGLKRMKTPAGVVVIGIDENTALVGGLELWEVMGKGSVWVMEDGVEKQYLPGNKFQLEI